MKTVIAILAYVLSDKRLVEAIINLAKVLASRSTNTVDDHVVRQIERLLKYLPCNLTHETRPPVGR